MEEIFTNNHNLKDPKFVEYLFEFNKTETYHNQSQMEYKRVWTKSIITYMHSYDDLDICLAPVTDIEFNHFKSNLKMLEAGVKKKPIIVSGVQPYLCGEHGKNCLIVEPRKEHKNWIKCVNQLVDSKQMQLDLGENLYDYVTTNFDLDKTTAKRAEVYKNLFK
jgi:glycosyltransferase involved in cell wall biosynthesis